MRYLLDHAPDQLLHLTKRFAGKTMLVVGDLLVDEYLYGRTSRVSREAPVLILRKERRSVAPGGAANTAYNLADLGVQVRFLGVAGMDGPGGEILDCFAAKGIDTTQVVRSTTLPTTTKTRILAGGHQTSFQQVVRLDEEVPVPADSPEETALLQRLEELWPLVDGVIISDYSLGVVSPAVVEAVNRLARTSPRVVTVDSRQRLLQFQGITAATPNEAELEYHMNATVHDDEALVARLGAALRQHLNAEMLLVTRGNRGMCLVNRQDEATFVPIYGPDEVADVTGAGDTVIATFTAALVCGASAIEATVLANMAGGLSVQKIGTATVPVEELREHLRRHRVQGGITANERYEGAL